jgi:hypothetical protein
MTFNGRMILPLLLLCFWLYMAWNAFSGGNGTLALIYLAVGIVITAWRLKAASA